MESHVYFAGPNGLCEVCGLPREACSREQQVWVAGGGQREKSVNPALVFFSQLPDTVKVYQMACTQHNTFVLSCFGEVYSWGETTNALGRLLGKRDEAVTPMLIDRLSVPIVAIACGDHHVLALDKSSTVWAWGLNKFGQLGLSDKADRPLPENIPSIQSIARIAAGPHCSFAVSLHGNVFVWGNNRNSQLGQAVDRSGKKKQEFLEPQEIYYMPWDKGGNVLVQHDKQAKTFFYKGTVTGQSDSSATTAEARRLAIENAELRTQVDRLTQRNTFLEGELLVQDGVKKPVWGEDPMIADLTRIKRAAINSSKDAEGTINTTSSQIELLEDDIKHLAENVKSLEEKEATNWDELEHMENELAKMLRDAHAQPEAVKLQKKLKGDLLAQTNALAQSKAEMNNLLSARQQEKDALMEKKAELRKQLEDHKRMAQVYDQMLFIRNKDLSSKIIESSTESIEQDLIDLAHVHDALQETSVKTISQRRDCTGLTDVVKISNELLTSIKDDLKKHVKEEDNPLQQHMNRVWEILQDNADLRLKINDYVLAIMEHTHQKLEEFYKMNSFFSRKEEREARSTSPLKFFSRLTPHSRSRTRRKRRSWC